MKRLEFRFLWLFISVLIVANLSTFAQSKTKKTKDLSSIKKTVIATVGNEQITYADLEKAFSKNLLKKDTPLHTLPKDSVVDFLNLYIKYRLKVYDAIQRGLDKDSAVLEEIKQNRRLLSESFYFDKKLVEPNVQKMLKYRENEAQVSYIFVKFTQNEFDTVEAYQRAKNLINLLKQGVDFATLAKDSSDDKETAPLGGLILNYVTGGKVQRQIEDAIFSLKQGEIYPYPIKTKFGYFIIKLNKIQPRIKVKARHILFALTKDSDTNAIRRKADSVLLLVRSGMDFSRLAEENSDDPASSIRGGDLGGWYSRSSGLEPSGKFFTSTFEEALFSLRDGEISPIIQTEYGFHIIRRDSTAKFSLEEEREDLKKLYKRIYYDGDKRDLITDLKKQYGFFVNYDYLQKTLVNLDTNKTTLDTAWYHNISTEIQNTVLFGILDKRFTIKDFVETLRSRNEFRATPLNTNGFLNAIDKIIYPFIIDKATESLEEEVPEFASLMKEFRDGILLFKVEASEVWEKLKFDTTLAKQYWEKNKSKYKTTPTYDVTEIFVTSDSLAKSIYRKAIAGEDFEKLAEQFTQRGAFREKKGHWGKINPKTNNLAKKLQEFEVQEGKIIEPFPFENGYSIVRINQYEPPREKTFEEAIPDFASDVQEILQKRLQEEWINSLKKRIPHKILTKNLEKVLAELKKS